MNKGLEALKALDKIINSVDGYTYYAESLDREYEIIEKALKEYQEIKTYMQQYEIENVEELRRILHNDWVIRQEFKTDTANVSNALEIIKRKKVNIALLLHLISYNPRPLQNYNDVMLNEWNDLYLLTKEEFGILKEALYGKEN